MLNGCCPVNNLQRGYVAICCRLLLCSRAGPSSPSQQRRSSETRPHPAPVEHRSLETRSRQVLNSQPAASQSMMGSTLQHKEYQAQKRPNMHYYNTIFSAYPVVMTYPRIGAPSDRLGLLQDNVIDRDVNPVTIGRPGGLGTSEI